MRPARITPISLSLIALAALLPTLSGQGCRKQEEPRQVSLRSSSPAPYPGDASSREAPLIVALGGMITPREGFAYYHQFLVYIERRLGIPVRAVDKENYAEINQLLKEGKVDFAFICSGPYVEGHDDFNLELLVAPQAYGKTVYNSYIIVPWDSPARSLADLKGRSFAYTDPMSNTGALVPSYMLARRGETKESFFSSCTFSHGHDKSIRAVAEKMVDGAAVDGLIWEYFRRIDPGTVNKTRVIEVSPDYGIPPVVVRAGLDPALTERLKKVFMEAHLEPEGKAILAGMGMDRFVEIEDGAYASIREMKTWLAANPPKP